MIATVAVECRLSPGEVEALEPEVLTTLANYMHWRSWRRHEDAKRARRKGVIRGA